MFFEYFNYLALHPRVAQRSCAAQTPACFSHQSLLDVQDGFPARTLSPLPALPSKQTPRLPVPALAQRACAGSARYHCLSANGGASRFINLYAVVWVL